MGVADELSILFSTKIKLVDGGFLVKETPTHEIHVLRMIYNWRIARSPKACLLTYDRAWCYFGTGIVDLLRTVQAALDWDGGDDTEPAGWDKNASTGEYAR